MPSLTLTWNRKKMDDLYNIVRDAFHAFFDIVTLNLFVNSRIWISIYGVHKKFVPIQQKCTEWIQSATIVGRIAKDMHHLILAHKNTILTSQLQLIFLIQLTTLEKHTFLLEDQEDKLILQIQIVHMFSGSFMPQ